MNETLKRIEQFHGHIGPYAIIGYKMGKIANQHLGEAPFSKHAIVCTGTSPPISCIIDGIQLSSGCTLGTGKITVRNEGIPKARFTNNERRSIEIILKSHIREEIDTSVNDDNIVEYSMQLYEKSDKELSLLMIDQKLKAIQDAGANCVVVVCPACYQQYEFNQRELNKQNESNYDFPVFYLSELVALAFGFKPEELGFNFHRIRPSKLFESIKFTP